MTGEKIYEFIQKSETVVSKMNRIIDSGYFKVTDGYTISGYTVEEIREVAYELERLLREINFEAAAKK
jgi:hypothetical protein